MGADRDACEWRGNSEVEGNVLVPPCFGVAARWSVGPPIGLLCLRTVQLISPFFENHSIQHNASSLHPFRENDPLHVPGKSNRRRPSHAAHRRPLVPLHSRHSKTLRVDRDSKYPRLRGNGHGDVCLRDDRACLSLVWVAEWVGDVFVCCLVRIGTSDTSSRVRERV